MFQVLEPVFPVGLRDLLRFDNQEVFGVLLLGCLRKIERTGDDPGGVYDHDLVVGYGVLAVDVGGNAHVGKERGGGIFRRALALVENGGHFYTALMGFDKGLRDGRGGEGICLDEYLGACRSDLPYDLFSAVSAGREAQAHTDIFTVLIGKSGDREYGKSSQAQKEKEKKRHFIVHGKPLKMP